MERAIITPFNDMAGAMRPGPPPLARSRSERLCAQHADDSRVNHAYGMPPPPHAGAHSYFLLSFLGGAGSALAAEFLNVLLLPPAAYARPRNGPAPGAITSLISAAVYVAVIRDPAGKLYGPAGRVLLSAPRALLLRLAPSVEQWACGGGAGGDACPLLALPLARDRNTAIAMLAVLTIALQLRVLGSDAELQDSAAAAVRRLLPSFRPVLVPSAVPSPYAASITAAFARAFGSGGAAVGGAAVTAGVGAAATPRGLSDAAPSRDPTDVGHAVCPAATGEGNAAPGAARGGGAPLAAPLDAVGSSDAGAPATLRRRVRRGGGDAVPPDAQGSGDGESAVGLPAAATVPPESPLVSPGTGAGGRPDAPVPLGAPVPIGAVAPPVLPARPPTAADAAAALARLAAARTADLGVFGYVRLDADGLR